MSPPKALGARLGSLHAAAFLANGIYAPFFPLWLESKALAATTIGVVLALPIVTRVLVTAPLLALPDRGISARHLLMLFSLGQALGFGLLVVADNSLLIVGLVGLISIAQAAVIPVNDLVTTNEVQKHPHLNYGRIRSAGSFAFLSANILGGYLIGLYGADVVIWSLTLIPLLGVAAAWVALPARETVGPAAEADSRGGPRLPTLLYTAITAASLAQASHGGLYGFASIYWHSVGFSDAVIGYLWATGVLAEIVVFILLGRFIGRGSDGLMLILIGSAAAVIRFTIMAFHPGIVLTFVLQVMHCLSFGASHLGMMAALTAFAPARARGQAQGLYGSLSALVMVVSMVLSGVVYREAGALVFAAMAPFGAAGIVLALFALRARAHPQSAGSGG